MADEVTRDGLQHIERWRDAMTSLARAKSSVGSAECELANAITALGKWMLPGDAKPDEVIAVWHGDSLIQVVNAKDGMCDFKITVRQRGRSLR